MNDPACLPATELLAALRERRISSRELLEHYLERIELHNRRLNAVLTLDERAVDAAAAADYARARGEDLGPLHGLPMTVKDAFETEGVRTAAGSDELLDHMPERDAVAVERLRSAGAVIFGKTNLPALASDGQYFNPTFGASNNPWDLTRSTSGSSGGSAGALAAGLTALELGSDLDGSIRRPAHFNGVFGLKPSYGLVPQRGHLPATADMNCIGPMARGVDDLELALEVLAGPDQAHAIAWQLELPPPRAAWLGDYRVAVWLDDPFCPVDSSALAVLRAAVGALSDAGVDVVERPGAVPLADAVETHRALLMAELSSGIADGAFAAFKVLAAGMPPSEDESESMQRARLLTQTKRDWNKAHERRRRMCELWAQLFLDFDAFLCPVAPTTALPHDHTPDLNARTITINGEERPFWDQVSWISYASAAYLPAVSAPVGLTETGLPVGLQVIGPYLEDRTAIDIARRLAEVLGGFQTPPEFRPVIAGVV
ncbi:MAG: amidase [Thermoleophilaceae bacterium]